VSEIEWDDRPDDDNLGDLLDAHDYDGLEWPNDDLNDRGDALEPRRDPEPVDAGVAPFSMESVARMVGLSGLGNLRRDPD